MITTNQVEFPRPEVLRRLALSDSGFVFDPLSGASYTVNGTGLALLRLLKFEQGNTDIQEVIAMLCEDFEVDQTIVEQDVMEFASVLRRYFK